MEVYTNSNIVADNDSDLTDFLDDSQNESFVSNNNPPPEFPDDDLSLGFPFPEEPNELGEPLPGDNNNAFGTPPNTTSTNATGINNIDALLRGTQWQSNSITYSFPNNFNNDYETNYADYSNHQSSFEALNSTQQNVGRFWFGMYEDISNLNMTELTGANDRDATMRLSESSVPSTAFAYYPNNFFVEGGDSWFNRNNFNNPQIGNYAFATFGHEIGHAYGLEHGHETGGVSGVAIESDRDSTEFSIMTYRAYVGHDLNALPFYTHETWGFPQTPMMFDIRAIQEMHGADFTTNSGNNIYTFSSTTGEMFIDGVGQGTPGANRIFRTVWDGDGVDTYNFANYTTDLSISLIPSEWSDLDAGGNSQRAVLNNGFGGITEYARGHVFNALQYNNDSRSLIENATGGTGNDSISGNGANNLLQGGNGEDFIFGRSGDDTLIGGNLNDTLAGNNGNDILQGGNNDDNLNGGNGDDSLSGGNGNDSLRGLGDEDTLVGNAGNDNLFGGSGNDDLSGNEGADFLRGEAGEDTLAGGDGNDNLLGGGNSDSLTGGSGNDVLRGEGGPDILNGGSGVDSIFGGPGRDTFVLLPNLNTSDRDIIRDFDLGRDRLGISSLSQVNDLSVTNNGANTASIIRNDSGQQVAVLSGVTGITIGDLDFIEV